MLMHNASSKTDASPLNQPDWLIGLSIQLGEDLTPHGDLEQRLDAAVVVTRCSEQNLLDLRDKVRAYELTVDGHTPVPQTVLDQLEHKPDAGRRDDRIGK